MEMEPATTTSWCRIPRRRPRPWGAAALVVGVVGTLAGGAWGQACNTAALSEKAQAVVRGNYDAAHGWTVPSPGVAPFLSSTDSLFAAYALSHFDPDLGMKEVLANLDGQWADGSGLVPRMRFPPEVEAEAWVPGTFFPGPSQWKAPRDGSGRGRATAGLASPPWHAFVAMQLFNARRDDAGLDFLAQAFPKLYRYHKYLHEARDAGNHLVLSYHPWESELPYDSPAWAELLQATQARLKTEAWQPPVAYKPVEGVPGFPGADVFEAELYLMDLMAALKYDDAAIQASSPYLTVDVEFNAILAYSDVSLAAMAKVLQLHSSSAVDDTARGIVTSWASTSTTRLEYLWVGDRYATYLVAPKQTPQAQAPAAPAAVVKDPPGITSPAKRRRLVANEEPKARGLRLGQPRPPKVGAVAPPPPPPPPTPLAAGAFLTVPVVSGFFPLLPGGLPPERVQGLLFQIITPGIASSFDCQGQVHRIPTSGCEVKDPQPEISLLHNLVVQRGLAANGDQGFNRWLSNETLALICGSSMDPFDQQSRAGKRGGYAGPFHFARFFDPVDGKPVPDQFGGEGATLAAALVFTLLNPDAPNVAETPPISHNLTFALVVIELIVAFATGVGCFLFSLSLFRRLSKGDEEAAGVMASMLHVNEGEEDEEGYEDEEGSAFGGDDEEEEIEEGESGGESKRGGEGRRQRQRRAGKGQGKGKVGGGAATPVKQGADGPRRRRGGPGPVAGSAGGGQYQTFRHIFSSPSRGRAQPSGPGPTARAGAAAAGDETSSTTSGSGGGLVGSVTGAIRSAAGFLKFW